MGHTHPFPGCLKLYPTAIHTVAWSYKYASLKNDLKRELHLQVLGQEPRLGDPFSVSAIHMVINKPETPPSCAWGSSASLWGASGQASPELGAGAEKTRNSQPNPHPALCKARPSEALEKGRGSPHKFSEPSEALRSSWRPLAAGPLFYSKSLEKTWNLGRQPATRKGKKLGGCLRKQGVGRINQQTNSWFVGHERCAVAIYAAPTPPDVSGRHFYMLPPAAGQQDALNPKLKTLNPEPRLGDSGCRI